MRKALLASLLLSLAAASASATQFWYDVVTNYNLGCITTNSGGLWWPHLPGTITATDALVASNYYTSGAAFSNGRRLRINGLNSEYIMRLFDPSTNVLYSGVVYASFIANAGFVPAAGVGTYFACFNNADTNNPPQVKDNGFDFRGRIYEIGAPNVAPFMTRVSNTFQWGISNDEGDPAQTNPGPYAYVPIDGIKSVDYQLVLKYDIDNATATLWVNPAAEGDTANMAVSGDIGAVANGLAGLLFRQRTAGGTVDIRDIAVGTSFADVMTNVAASSPVLVATNYNTVTNYSGNPALLEVFATSIGGGPLIYQWYRVSGGITNAVGGNSQTYLVPSLAGSDTGSYFCAVTNSGGQGALSPTAAKFYISVNATPTAPTFTIQPASGTAPLGGTMSLASSAFGTGPLTYAWTFNGNPISDGVNPFNFPGDACVVSGSSTPTLTISKLSTNETGNYQVTVTGNVAPQAVSTNAHMVVNLPVAVNIGYIRSLENAGNSWQETDIGDLFTVTGVVTTYTNTTTGNTASYYIQDATGGINFFVSGDSSFRPTLGDILTGTGTLSMYNNNIELYINNAINPYSTYAIIYTNSLNGYTNLLPAPMVFAPMSLTNSAPDMEYTYEGRLVTLTNVGFTGSLVLGSGNTSIYVTNSGVGSVPFNVYFPGATDPDVANQTLKSRFAWTITGVIVQYKTGTTWGPSGYELYVTRFGDVVTNPPPAVTVTESRSGNNVVLNWTAVPYTAVTRGVYAYSVLAATDVTGPYLPLATGLTFNTTNGTYTDVNALLGTKKFYRISSP